MYLKSGQSDRRLRCAWLRRIIIIILRGLFDCTVDIAYMVTGYMVKSDIWSILRWSQFSYTKIYPIYVQISDIWSEILVKFMAKAIDRVANEGWNHIHFGLILSQRNPVTKSLDSFEPYSPPKKFPVG